MLLVFGATFGACSSFNGTDNGATAPPTDADGGNSDSSIPPVTGTDPGAHKITITIDDVASRSIVQGKDNEVAFHIVRSAAAVEPVTVVATGLPADATAAPVMLITEATIGKLIVHPSAADPQGSFSFMLAATENGHPEATSQATVTAFLRGAPGTLDTTFTAAGALTIGSTSGVFVIDSMDRIYAHGDDISRFDIDGKPAPGKIADSIGTPFKLFINGGHLIACGGSSLTTRGFYRFNTEGAVDQGFGVQGFAAFNRGGAIEADGIDACGVNATGMLAASVAGSGDSILTVFLATGTGGASGGYGGSMTAGIYTDEGLFVGAKYAAGNESLIRGSPAGFDSSFDVALPGSVDGITDIVQDAMQRYVLVGPSFIGRVSHGGALDSFPNTQPPFGGVLHEAHLALAKDGKIIRGQAIGQQCAVMRYNADGTPDTAFGNNGATLLPATGCAVAAVGLFADGRILLGSNTLYRVWGD